MPNTKKLSKKLIKKITELIEGGETSVTRICSLTGISRRVWYKWAADESAQFADAISRARAHAREKEDEKLVSDSKRSMLLLLQGFFLTKTEHKTEFLDEGGEEKTVTVSVKYVPPCTNTIIFVLENKDKHNFSSRFKRHAKAQFGHFSNLAANSGARILTLDEAFALGLIDSTSIGKTAESDLTRNHYLIQNLK